MFWWLFVGAAGLIMLILISALTSTLSLRALIGGGLVLFSYFAGWIYLRVAGATLEKRFMRKKSFDYCWMKMNEQLALIPGGERLEWKGGFGRHSDLRAFKTKSGEKTFRSMYGTTEYSKQFVLVIWCIEDEDIARYVAEPPPEMISNPWFNFKPFDDSDERLRTLESLRRLGGSRSLRVSTRKTLKPEQPYVSKGMEELDLFRGDGRDE